MSIFSHLIFDTNAFRYLDELDLLDVCLEAVESPLTLDMIRDIELKKPCWEDVACHGVAVLSLDGKMMAEAVSCMSKCRGLSIYDAGLIVLGQCFGYPVFTEDRKMIRELSFKKVRHVSLPEVIEGLVFEGYLSPEGGADAAEVISSQLLPGRYDKECAYLREKFSS